MEYPYNYMKVTNKVNASATASISLLILVSFVFVLALLSILLSIMD